MNRREFLSRTLYVAAALGVPSVAVTASASRRVEFSFDNIKTIYGAVLIGRDPHGNLYATSIPWQDLYQV